MEPSDWSLVLAMIGGTVLVCGLAPLVRSRAPWLPSTIQFLSGFVIPPLLAWGIFSYWGSVRGTHNSGGLLLFAWFVCAIVGMFVSRRTGAKSHDRQA